MDRVAILSGERQNNEIEWKVDELTGLGKNRENLIGGRLAVLGWRDM